MGKGASKIFVVIGFENTVCDTEGESGREGQIEVEGQMLSVPVTCGVALPEFCNFPEFVCLASKKWG